MIFNKLLIMRTFSVIEVIEDMKLGHAKMKPSPLPAGERGYGIAVK